MSLSIEQRLARLDVRIAELDHWRERESRPIRGWSFEGQPIEAGGAWPRRDGTVHLAAEATVPDHWPLADTRLHLDVGGESLLTLTVPGEAPQRMGLDPFHQEFRVPGARFAIATESVARLPFGEPVREPRLAVARLIWVDRDVHRLALLLRQVWETATMLGSHEVVPHLVAAGERTLAALDWPSNTEDYVARTASAPAQQRIWRLPPLKPDPGALRQDERASAVTAHDDLAAELRRLKQLYPQQGAIAVTGHAHIDLAWLWPYDETRRKLRRTFHTALGLMEQTPGFVFNQSTAAYYDQVERDDPELFAAIKREVARGSWETLGGMWVEPDTNMPTGESFVRQILYGQRYFQRTFGLQHRVCWLPDCFGFSGALPQLLRQGGMDSFFTIKVNWSETNRFPHDLFWWEGLDGSRVLAHTFDNPVRGYNGSTEPEAVIATWRNFRGKVLHDESLLCVGYGDGGGGVTPEMLERQAQLADFPAVPRLRPARVDAFFARLHETAATAEVPVWIGEIYLELHRATLTTQGHTKRLHRQAERALITAETVASLARLLGGPHPGNLEAHWRPVLKNEFHDILPGSGIREIYEDAERELTASRDAGLEVQGAAMESLAALVPRGSLTDALLLANPDLHARPLRLDHEGLPLVAPVTVPPLGVAIVDRGALTPPAGLSADAGRLENATVLVEIGRDGTVTRFYDKRHDREVLAGRGNQLWAYPMDKPRNWDAWDIEDDHTAKGIELTDIDAIACVETGPHRAAVRITRRFRDSTIVQTLRLWADSPRLEFVTELDWHDRRVLLRAVVPVAVRAETATFECAFGVVHRPTHANTSWQEAQFEGAAHRFIDLSEPGYGVALLNTAKYGHSVRGNLMGLSLLRAPIYPDPLADEGVQAFTYAIFPHAGDWIAGGVREEAADLNQPLLAVRATGVAPGTHTPLAVTGLPVGLAGLKPAEDGGDLVFRVYEPAGARGPFGLSVPDGWALGETVDILERPLARPARLGPFEVRSWRLTRR